MSDKNYIVSSSLRPTKLPRSFIQTTLRFRSPQISHGSETERTASSSALNRSIELPSIFRNHSQARAPCIMKETGQGVDIDKLKDLEECVWSILEGIRDDKQTVPFEKYWKISQGIRWEMFEDMFRDESMRRGLREAVILEHISVALTEILYGSQSQIQLIDSLMLNIHKNSLSALQHVMSSNGSSEVFRDTFSKRVVMRRKDQITEIRQRNLILKNMIKSIIHILPSTYSMLILKLLKNTNHITIPKAVNLIFPCIADLRQALSTSLRPTEPYLPPKSDSSKKYTLVLDLDETLIHSYTVKGNEKLNVRPHCMEFLHKLSDHYELVIFTAGIQSYADRVIDSIDTDRLILYRLYRQHIYIVNYNAVKDMSKLGRDLTKIIIVDNIAENFKLQPENGIVIKTWRDDMKDTALNEVANILLEIIHKQVNDVRKALVYLRELMRSQYEKGESISLSLANFVE